MSKILPKTSKNVKISQILRMTDGTLNRTRNPREMSVYDPTNPEFGSLVDFTAERIKDDGNVGWSEDVVLMEAADFKESGIYIILRGHRRLSALDELIRDGRANAEQPFRAVIYAHLDDFDAYDIILDHGTRVDLTKVELYNAIKMGDRAGMTEKTLALKFRPMLERLGKPLTEVQLAKIGDLTTEAGKQKLLDRYKGQIRNHKWASQSPNLVEEAWVDKLRGKQNWPADNELVQLFQTYISEVKENPGAFTQESPGPKFMALWNKISQARATAAAAGTKATSKAMMGHKEVEKLQLQTPSRILQLAFAFVRNDIDRDHFDKAVAVQIELEKTLTDEQKQRLLSAMGAPVPTDRPIADPTTPANANGELVNA